MRHWVLRPHNAEIRFTLFVGNVVAWLMILEKHFTHDASLPQERSLSRVTLNHMQGTERRWTGLLHYWARHKSTGSEEIARKNARRSIVVSRNLDSGHRITEEDITYKRPGTGISPLSWDEVIGRVTSCSLEADTVIQWSDLE